MKVNSVGPPASFKGIIYVKGTLSQSKEIINSVLNDLWGRDSKGVLSLKYDFKVIQLSKDVMIFATGDEAGGLRRLRGDADNYGLKEGNTDFIRFYNKNIRSYIAPEKLPKKVTNAQDVLKSVFNGKFDCKHLRFME